MFDRRKGRTARRGRSLAGWLVALFVFFCLPQQAAAAGSVLRSGSTGPDVVLAQHVLYQLGFLRESPDGVFGPATLQAVRRFQQEWGLAADGVIGVNTWEALRRALDERKTVVHVVQPNETIWALARRYQVPQDLLVQANGLKNPSLIRAGDELIIPATAQAAGQPHPGVELLRWDEVQKIYAHGKVVRVIDVRTGKSFRVRRYYGTNHADSEPLTQEDTAIMREVFGGWSWERRPIIVEVDGRRIAASMNGMPHGNGSIADNGFPGHFCIHFLGSRTHQSNKIDPAHQAAVLEAAGYQVKTLWLALGGR